MSFLLNENSSGRRRIAQVSNDEWRAALQQQIDEKRQQQKRFCSYEDDHQPPQQQSSASQQLYDDAEATNNSNNCWDANDPQSQQQVVVDQSLLMPRPGRRGVQQLSNDAYREALEQQIREKKGRETSGVQQRRRSQSAPGQEGHGGSFSEPGDQYMQQQMAPERAMTTPSVNHNSDPQNVDPQTGISHGRKRVGMQTQEEFAKSLHDQLEVQKRFEQEALEFKKAQRQLRRKLLVGDEPENLAADSVVPAPASTAKAKSDSATGDEELIFSPKQLESAEPETLEFKENEDSTSEPGNQVEEPSRGVSEPERASVVAADPTALAKIVDFCEELKRQNEEVKQQLSEQHSVLASLRSSLVEAKAESKGVKQPAELAKQTRSGGKKLHQAARGAPQRRAGTLAAPRAEEKASKPKKTANSDPKNSTSTNDKEIKGVEMSTRPPVVRSRPLFRGESKIPFPSGVSSATSSSSSCVSSKALEMAEPKNGSGQMAEAGQGGDDLKDAAPSSEQMTPEADDARPDDWTDKISERACRDDGSDDAEMDSLNEDAELRDAKKHQVEWRDGKFESSEEPDELKLIQSESFLLLDEDDAEILDGDELPLGCESKLVRCEGSPRCAEEEIKSCSSFVLVDGTSSLVPLDHSLGDLFFQ